MRTLFVFLVEGTLLIPNVQGYNQIGGRESRLQQRHRRLLEGHKIDQATGVIDFSRARVFGNYPTVIDVESEKHGTKRKIIKSDVQVICLNVPFFNAFFKDFQNREYHSDLLLVSFGYFKGDEDLGLFLSQGFTEFEPLHRAGGVEYLTNHPLNSEVFKFAEETTMKDFPLMHKLEAIIHSHMIFCAVEYEKIVVVSDRPQYQAFSRQRYKALDALKDSGILFGSLKGHLTKSLLQDNSDEETNTTTMI